MPKIKKLPLHEAQKIAAGEVVDRPANVVKELVENSLDAGATHIGIYIEQAGKKLIRIVDNGLGMSAEDAQLCFEQHATSKIASVEEIHKIATFGFRGEALPSIAAVSSVTLITKEADDEHGSKVILEHGNIISSEVAASTTGTDIAVQNLFSNVPARKKFMKSDETEWRAIANVVQAFCLDYINVHVKLFHDGKQIYNCHPTTSLVERIAQLSDSSLAQAMIPLENITNKDQSISIEGAISNHHYSRYDRNNIFIFVNKRWVKNHQLSSALIKGYSNVLQAGKYPAACLFITVDPAQVDINIHPRKEEVQFLHPIKVTTLIQETVKKTLEENLSRQLKKTVTLAAPKLEAAFHPAPSLQNLDVRFTPFDFEAFHVRQTTVQTAKIPAKVDQEIEDHSTPIVVSEVEPYRIIGQYHKTYILLEQEEGLFLVDQHAAHERILYEQFSQRFDEVTAVKLLFPHIITLQSGEAELIERHAEIFKIHGIDIERFSDNQIIIQATPVHLKNSSFDDLIRQVVSWIQEYASLDKQLFFTTIHEKLRAQMACKAAVKAGDELSQEKMEQLLRDLTKTANRFTCPHGRPTGWLLSLHEIEKKFKRKL